MSCEEVQLEEPEEQAIEVARFFSEGDGCELTLNEAFQQSADSKYRRTSLFFSLGYDTKFIERSNIGWVTLKDSLSAAWGAILHSHEPDWQRGRLAWLCEIWTICGERTPFLLRERSMPLDEPEDLRIRP